MEHTWSVDTQVMHSLIMDFLNVVDDILLHCLYVLEDLLHVVDSGMMDIRVARLVHIRLVYDDRRLGISDFHCSRLRLLLQDLLHSCHGLSLLHMLFLPHLHKLELILHLLSARCCSNLFPPLEPSL